ncbi:RiPP maturation radical SAM C-methyltransferase [Azospirillum sp. ST 5-10]|uniref:RiPP maturation radical SAM C-methyltransferase n=1 Tax=unclassified Azospirillum TaxID=2630922 RepID=UPI003F4A8494
MAHAAAEARDGGPPGRRVLLVQMPWANLNLPSMALGLLKAVLDGAGLPCDTLHANLHAAGPLCDVPVYDRLSVDQASELVFSPLYFGSGRSAAAARLAEAVAPGGPDGTRTDGWERLIDAADRFLARLIDTVPWQRYDIVGFSLTFQQTLSSLALARRIKAVRPDVAILFGGASCEGPMGREMLRAFPELDYVVDGEADRTIADVVRAIRLGPQAVRRAGVPGLLFRTADGVDGAAPALTPDLDATPEPDYGEYFAAVAPLLDRGVRPRIYLEQSRGCWYGEKNACRFCGIPAMAYRRKSPERALREMLSAARRYGFADYYMSDNILDHRYYDTLLPELARLRRAGGPDVSLFYEIKSNLTRRHARILAEAGVVAVQVGIESFDDDILRLMAKGVSAIRQIQTLRYLAEHRIHAVWNIIHSIPGERAEHYERMTALLPSLHHLPPPMAAEVGPMVLQRFSVYWRDPAAFGIANIRPQPLYHAMFPTAAADLGALACFFDYDHPQHADQALAAARERFIAAVGAWRDAHRPDLLTCTGGPDAVVIADRRGGDGIEVTLTGLQAAIFLFCDAARPRREIHHAFAGRAAAAEIDAFLDRLAAMRILHRDDADRHLSLPLHAAP